MMPKNITRDILDDIKKLSEYAGIKDRIIPYTALNHHFSSYGGSFSISSPVLFLPHQHLFRPDGQDFTREAQKPNSIWVFSDDETRFLIARELGQIKENNSLLHVAIKVATVAAFLSIFAAPFSFYGFALTLVVLGSYILSERSLETSGDLRAIEILEKYGVKNPKQVAIDTIKKLQEQNRHYYENYPLTQWYISKESGDNWLDLTSPFLSSRLRILAT